MTCEVPAIVVHSLAHAVAALAAAIESGRVVLLLSAADAARAVGAGWWRETIRVARDSVPGSVAGGYAGALLDCGDDAGAAQAALRDGVAAIVFTGQAEVAERLADIAGQRGSRVYRRRPVAALDLADDFFAPPDALRHRVLTALRRHYPEISGFDAKKSQDTGSS
jgi:hypothetical protein